MTIMFWNNKGELFACIFGFFVGLPWLFSYSYSLGYDLPLWIYNGWYLKETLLNGIFPNWSPLAAAGQPFFKISGLADGVLVALFMEAFGVFKGVQFFMCALYVLAAAGLYKLSYFLKPCQISALTASGAYILSWFISFTAHFQAYISNLFVYALLPFFVLFAFQLIEKFSVEKLFYSAVILAVAVLANPQVAIKMTLIALLAITPVLNRSNLRMVFGLAISVVILALLLAMFDIVSALRLREEVITANARSNSLISPFALIAIPSYALSLFVETITGVRWPNISLHELLYSKYPGFLLVILSILALRVQDSMGPLVRSMWGVVLSSYVVFFFVMPYVPAAPWVGISHNLLIIPTFFLALLSGFGMNSLLKGKFLPFKEPKRWGGLIAFLGFVELGVLMLGLRANAGIGVSPDKLPQISLWNEIEYQTEEEDSVIRFFSFAPDHSKNLFPVITALPTANVIELRQRSPEYQSYVDLIKRCSREVGCTQSISKLLAPLNVGYVDLPANFYTYNGPVKEPNDYSYFVQGLLKYDLDNQLERVGERTVSVLDLRPKATSTIWSPWDASPSVQSTNGRLEQVLFKNYFHIPARVCDGAIAIIGTDLEPEKIFEQLALLPQFEPARYSFVLAQSLSDIREDVKNSLLGYTSAGYIEQNSSITQLSMTDIKQLYEADTKMPPKIEISTFLQDGERLKIELEQPVQRDRFLFVSQQFFRDWHAVDEKGHSVSLFKIGGGLTGAFLEKGTQKIELRYSLPLVERLGRWISFITCLSVGSLIAVRYFTEQKNK